MKQIDQIQEKRAFFHDNRYALITPLLVNPVLMILYRYVMMKRHRGEMGTGDHTSPGTPCCYGDALADVLLESLRPTIEQYAGAELYSTYAYFRVYKEGDKLDKHTDREACEISLSVHLGPEPITGWPLWVESAGKPMAITQNCGDALLYRGIEVPHWREPFTGDHHAQIFFHYVDKNGPYEEWKYDKRGATTI